MHGKEKRGRRGEDLTFAGEGGEALVVKFVDILVG
jgi:hypothetical protein